MYWVLFYFFSLLPSIPLWGPVTAVWLEAPEDDVIISLWALQTGLQPSAKSTRLFKAASSRRLTPSHTNWTPEEKISVFERSGFSQRRGRGRSKGYYYNVKLLLLLHVSLKSATSSEMSGRNGWEFSFRIPAIESWRSSASSWFP